MNAAKRSSPSFSASSARLCGERSTMNPMTTSAAPGISAVPKSTGTREPSLRANCFSYGS